MKLTRRLTTDIAARCRVLFILIACFLGLVVLRLVKLQLLDGDRYRLFAQALSIKTQRLPAPRGLILDRHGEPLVLNREVSDVGIVSQALGDPPRVAAALADLLSLSPPEVEARMAERSVVAPYQFVPIAEDVNYDRLARLRVWQAPWPDPTDRYDLRGVEIASRSVRMYPDGTIAPHMLGYLREVNSDELAARGRDNLAARDLIGATGLEAAADSSLRGVAGYEERLVDARGREVDLPEWGERLARIAPHQGTPIQVTLDGSLQRVAATAMVGKQGAVVALVPATGEVLVMYSSPGYDLNAMHGAQRRTYWQTLLNDSDKPLLHRAIQSAYPPGSIYKIVTGAAGLSEGVVSPYETVDCRGALTFGGRRFGCWRSGGHGSVDFRRALTESCDVYFYTVGLRLGVDRLAQYAALFGLGRPTGIDLPHEQAGLIPTSQWKEATRKQPWQPGETLSIAIGQGYDSVTPLQAAVMITTVANGGRPVHPHLLPRGEPSARDGFLSSDVLAALRDGLEQVVASPAGTAHALHRYRLGIAGKTGTAQVVALFKGRGHGKLADHGWFVAYAPADAPQIAVAVVVEHGGHGGAVAAPIAGELIASYLSEGS